MRLWLSRDTCPTTLLDASDEVARYDCTNMMIIVENDGESVGLTEVNVKISKEM